MADRISVGFFGMFPPIVTGQAIANEWLYQKMVSAGIDVIRINLTPIGARENGKSQTLNKLATYFNAIAFASKSKPNTFYLSLEANSGKFLSLPILLIARIFRRHCVVHHHAYSYIANPCYFYLLISLYLLPHQLHVFQCEAMAQRYLDKIPESLRPKHMTLSNAAIADHSTPLPTRKETSVAVGFMGAVTKDKGIHRALALVEALLERGVPAKLLIAGPSNDEVYREITEASARSCTEVEWWGVVSGDEKRRFFNSIDVFAFPSTYVNETQGIVNIEAMAFARPVVAIGQCCVGSTILPFGGAVTTDSDHFTEFAAEAVIRWRRDDGFLNASIDARRQFENQLAASEVELSRLIACIENFSSSAAERRDAA